MSETAPRFNGASKTPGSASKSAGTRQSATFWDTFFGEAEQEGIIMVEGHSGGQGGGLYTEPGKGEVGAYKFRNLNDLLSAGGGVGLQGIGISSRPTVVSGWAFLALEVPGDTKALGAHTVGEYALLVGFDTSPSLYVGTIVAGGAAVGIKQFNVAGLVGKETTWTLHPLDALNFATDAMLSDTFKSVIGPLADPSNSLADPSGMNSYMTNEPGYSR